MKHIAYTDKFSIYDEKVPITDGLLCGNGDTGIIACGTKEGLRLFISKNDLWKADQNSVDSDGGIKPLGYIDFVPETPVLSYHAQQRMDEGELFCRLKTQTGLLEVTVRAEHEQGMILLSIAKSNGFSAPRLKVISGCGSDSREYTENEISHISRCFSGEQLKFNACCYASMKEVARGKYALCVRSDFDKRKDTISYLTETDFDALRQKDLQWWSDFYAKSKMSLPALPTVELNWYACLYHLAVCALNKEFPPGIYGNFITHDYAWWKGDYHLNYNFQAPFYGVFSANHTELSDCFAAPVEDFFKEGERLAREHLGCRGVLYPVGIAPKGMYSEYPPRDIPFERVFLGQRTNASYCAVIFLMRWYAQRDTDYARQHIYPFVKAVGDFWEDFAVYENGKYCIYRDAIHEIPYYRSDFSYKKYKKEIESKNNLLSLGFVKMIFSGLLDMSSALGTDLDRREKWQHILDNISPYPTQIRGLRRVYRYTQKGIAWRNDNSLCIQHIYPAGTIGRHSDEKTVKIAKNTLLLNDRFCDGNATNSVFPCAARLGIDGDFLIKKLMLNYSKNQKPNLLLNYGGGCLENCSLTLNTINESVLQSFDGIISVFPIWNLNTECEFENLLANGNILVSARAQKGKVDYVILKPNISQTIRLEIKGKRTVCVSCNGAKQYYSTHNGVFIIPVEKGKEYKII